jgi:hypothetical protein
MISADLGETGIGRGEVAMEEALEGSGKGRGHPEGTQFRNESAGIIEREPSEGPVKKTHVGIDDTAEVLVVVRPGQKRGGGSREQGGLEHLAAFHDSIRRGFQ